MTPEPSTGGRAGAERSEGIIVIDIFLLLFYLLARRGHGAWYMGGRLGVDDTSTLPPCRPSPFFLPLSLDHAYALALVPAHRPCLPVYRSALQDSGSVVPPAQTDGYFPRSWRSRASTMA